MARNKDVPQVWQLHDADGGGYRRLRNMTASELAERDEAQFRYEQMLARQQAYEDRLPTTRMEPQPAPVGCVFTKSCKLPDAVIDYVTPTGFIPTDAVANYGALTLLGGREVEADGRVPLKRISGTLPANLGALALGGVSVSAGTAGNGLGLISSGVAAGALLGLVALLAPSSLGDGALYSEEQLRNLKQARTRLRLRVEQQADGRLKGYGFNTQGRREWEMIPVAEFEARGEQQVADLGDGITLIWTPAVDPSSTTGIPPLEAAPQTPPIWIFPPTEAAERIIVSPIYPPEYRDFILVFPPGSGVQPLYIVINARYEPGIVTGQGKDVSGSWLAGAGEGAGVPIPSRIADQLRGRKFNRFDDFREAFWTAVGRDTELLGQFNGSNQGKLLKGRAPFAPRSEHYGENSRYELHHIDYIKHGGEVYDIENLGVMTPKRHIEIHKQDRK
ncbi:S-type pyocin domain-containing protein [Pseudomonas sp. NFIX28]|uniref:S-type pyocin domain-containing protein n=1 Tax=Pseudomonas sp. NFIX28 TaxID=1566235 RepID=UPI0008969C91|nr:S-type pyocin domain-containing protein [Pseudomonas sp. NFIX28]SDZ66608.1 DNase/tRNase domain of colicin-like bacteriocin [Pseudomonas sp. NFIX28]